MDIKRKIRIVFKALYDEDARFLVMNKLGLYDNMPDEEYLKRLYKSVMGKELDIDNPKTFNEKLQWLKLYNRCPEYTTMVDKYAVKRYVADKIGEKYIIPTLGVWDHFDDIDFSTLPKQFVLKCTHDSGGLVICKDKAKLDVKKAKSKIEKSLKNNFYLMGREWPYKNVKPRIIAEQYMEDNPDSQDLTDYKLMCFNGKVKCSFTCTSRYAKDGLKVTFFDTNWERMPFERHYPAEPNQICKPKSYEEMTQLAEKLADKIPFVRIDFYEIKGKPYFGEMTFFPGNGMEEFTPEEWDGTLGSWIELPNKEGKLLFTNGGVILLRYNKKEGLSDYKFFCFDGKVKLCYVSDNSHSLDQHIQFFDRSFNPVPIMREDYLPYAVIPRKPDNLDEIIHIAEKLSANIPHVRVDFYVVQGRLYFGEFTFYTGSGYIPFSDKNWDIVIGEWLQLPETRMVN